mgnify:CR=1 FL=1
MKNEKIKNIDKEFSEQKLLSKYVKKDNNVLQLGGNIGSSCIYVDKILENDNINICVEPHPKIIEIFKKK